MSATQQIVCPVCFTQQPNAWDCAVCGAALHDKPKHWAVPVEQVEGLEITRFDDPGNLALEPMPGLERTGLDDGWEPLPEEVEGLEPTHFEASGPVVPEPIPTLEPTALAAPEGHAAPQGTSCRYCGTPWDPRGSVFCSRCGLRVHTRPRQEAKMETGVTCPGCGMPDQESGSFCRSCQAPLGV